MPEPSVSLHAQLRWMERVEGLDVDGTRKSIEQLYDRIDKATLEIETRDALLSQTGRTRDQLVEKILTPGRIEAIKAGASGINCENGYSLKIKNFVVVTVINLNSNYSPRGVTRRRKQARKQIRRSGFAI